jgi:hypothetical protein
MQLTKDEFDVIVSMGASKKSAASKKSPSKKSK